MAKSWEEHIQSDLFLCQKTLNQSRYIAVIKRMKYVIGSYPSDHYFRSVCWFICLSVCLFVCAEFFSAVFGPILIKLGHMLNVWV